MKRTNGYTLIFVIGVIALLAGLAAMLAGPSVQQQRRVDLHYRKIQAEYLSLAGIERAKEWRSQGVVTNALYLLANGTVDVRMEPDDAKQVHVISVGRIRAEWRKDLIEARNEVTIQLP